MGIGRVQGPVKILGEPRDLQKSMKKKKASNVLPLFGEYMGGHSDINEDLSVPENVSIQLEVDRLNSEIREAVDAGEFHRARDLSLEMMKMRGRLL